VEASQEKKEKRAKQGCSEQNKNALWWLTDLQDAQELLHLMGWGNNLQREEVLQESKEAHTHLTYTHTPNPGALLLLFFKCKF
jgi:hypothetical protein